MSTYVIDSVSREFSREILSKYSEKVIDFFSEQKEPCTMRDCVLALNPKWNKIARNEISYCIDILILTKKLKRVGTKISIRNKEAIK